MLQLVMVALAARAASNAATMSSRSKTWILRFERIGRLVVAYRIVDEFGTAEGHDALAGDGAGRWVVGSALEQGAAEARLRLGLVDHAPMLREFDCLVFREFAGVLVADLQAVD